MSARLRNTTSAGDAEIGKEEGFSEQTGQV